MYRVMVTMVFMQFVNSERAGACVEPWTRLHAESSLAQGSRIIRSEKTPL